MTWDLINMLRRHIWRWLAVAALSLFISAAALPATSSAAALVAPRCTALDGGQFVGRCLPVQPATASVNHVGWVYLNLNYCAPGMACIALYRDSMAAWSWSGSAWRASSLRQGWVYVYPYTGAWRWAWTQDTGWVAVTGGRFEFRAF